MTPRQARIAVLDYGMGNLRSAEKALEHVGAEAERTRDHERIRSADGLVLPGDGAFPKAMERIRSLELDRLLAECLAEGTPVLGICVGMQVLFEGSTELGGARGLGLLRGTVERLHAPGLKLPHIGWSAVSWRRRSRLVEGLPDPCAFYHVHSYAPVGVDEADVVGSAEHGAPFASVVEREGLFGVQFHPEKSATDGLALLRNFAGVCAARLQPAPA